MPHDTWVIVNAPAVFRFTADACPQRHLDAARLLGAEVDGAWLDDAGEIVAERLIALTRRSFMPNGVGGVGYVESDVATLFNSAMRYW